MSNFALEIVFISHPVSLDSTRERN